MSNINAKNIISENITVTNLNVTNINGRPYKVNPCADPCAKGYYVPCPDCDYTGPDNCDCGNSCEWYYADEREPDECDCFVPCNNGNIPGSYFGRATLVAGTVTVTNPLIQANDLILVTPIGNTNEGLLSVTIVASTSFTITSSNVADTRTVNYMVIINTI